jgi:hypothetical protein
MNNLKCESKNCNNEAREEPTFAGCKFCEECYNRLSKSITRKK